MKTYQLYGHLHGYPWGVTHTVQCETIEEAHEEAEERLDDVVSVKEINQ